MDGWKVLPDVLLLDIYSYLSFQDKISASSTCKNWRQLLYHPVNWGHISFDFTKDNCERETFLTSKTGHFLRYCSIKLPIALQLYIDDEAQADSVASSLEIGCLLRRLSHNKNLTGLCFEQSLSCHEDSSYYRQHDDIAAVDGDCHGKHPDFYSDNCGNRPTKYRYNSVNTIGAQTRSRKQNMASFLMEREHIHLRDINKNAGQ